MKKIWMFFIVMLPSLMQIAQAHYVVNLDWVPRGEGEQPIHQAAKVIMWANAGEAFFIDGVEYGVSFEKNERRSLDRILCNLRTTDMVSIAGALENSQLHLDLDVGYYKLNDGKNTAYFRVAVSEYFRAKNTLEPLFPEKREHDRCKAYCAYLFADVIDPQVLNAILVDVRHFYSQERKDLVFRGCIQCTAIDDKTLRGVIAWVQQYSDEYYRACFYRDYIQCDRADCAIISAFLDDAKLFQYSEYTAKVYAAYARSESPDLKTLQRILEDVNAFQSEIEKARVYVAYMGCSLISQETIRGFFIAAQSFYSEYDKAKIYAAYIKLEMVDFEAAHLVLNTLIKQFTYYNKADIYVGYLQREQVDLAVVDAVLRDTKNSFPKDNRVRVWAAYITRPEADHKIIDVFVRAVENLSDYCKLTVYKAYLLRSDTPPAVESFLVKKLETLKGGAEALVELAAFHGKKRPKSARM